MQLSLLSWPLQDNSLRIVLDLITCLTEQQHVSKYHLLSMEWSCAAHEYECLVFNTWGCRKQSWKMIIIIECYLCCGQITALIIYLIMLQIMYMADIQIWFADNCNERVEMRMSWAIHWQWNTQQNTGPLFFHTHRCTPHQHVVILMAKILLFWSGVKELK